MAAASVIPIREEKEWTPFDEDQAVCRVAECLGFSVQYRRRVVEVIDEKLLADAGLMTSKPRPDYGRILKLIEAGTEVPGVCTGGMEYVLRARQDGAA